MKRWSCCLACEVLPTSLTLIGLSMAIYAIVTQTFVVMVGAAATFVMSTVLLYVTYKYNHNKDGVRYHTAAGTYKPLNSDFRASGKDIG